MRLVLACSLIGLATTLIACGGQGSGELSPDSLFDTSRSDVAAYRADHGAELGLANTTHGLAWDYALGYSRFGVDNKIMWGPVMSFPESELEQLGSRDASQSLADDGVEVSEQEARGGTTAGGAAAVRARAETVCTCCYVRLDGTCGCLLCKS